MMFARHVSGLLPAYCDGALDKEREAEVRRHLDGCPACRRELAEVERGIRLARVLPGAAAPESLWEQIEAALPARGKAPAARRTLAPRLLAGGAVAAVVLIAAILGHRNPVVTSPVERGPAWRVVRVTGSPRVGQKRLGPAGRLAVGQWLETDSASRAEIGVADIGRVVVEPDSRVGLVASGPRSHRLDLDHGGISAHVTAPPRIFLVDTPSATAVDLGCSYTLNVDRAGNGIMRVKTGRVAFARGGRECVVPAGADCLTRKGIGPGTPSFEDASAPLRDALRRYDFESGGMAALDQVLQSARRRDAFTVWNLLTRAPESDRPPIVDRLNALIPMPKDVTRDLALRLDSRALASWQERIELLTWE